MLEIGETKEFWYWQGAYAEITRISENEYQMTAVEGNSSHGELFLGVFESIEACEKYYLN